MKPFAILFALVALLCGHAAAAERPPNIVFLFADDLGKHTQNEGGVRIPFIVRWPGQVPAARVDETSVLSGADWLPTLCTLAGAKSDPADSDGENAAAAWRGEPFTRTKPLLWKTSNPNADAAIRDGQWKLHYPNKKRGELALHDLAADPAEQVNLAAKHPDIVQSLSAKVEAWQATLPKSYDKTGGDDDKCAAAFFPPQRHPKPHSQIFYHP